MFSPVGLSRTGRHSMNRLSQEDQEIQRGHSLMSLFISLVCMHSEVVQ